MEYYVVLVAITGMYENDCSYISGNKFFGVYDSANKEFEKAVHDALQIANLSEEDLLLKDKGHYVYGDTTGKRVEVTIEELCYV